MDIVMELSPGAVPFWHKTGGDDGMNTCHRKLQAESAEPNNDERVRRRLIPH